MENQKEQNNGEIIIYQSEDGKIRLDVSNNINVTAVDIKSFFASDYYFNVYSFKPI